ncbi:MAG: hypothetical protein Q8Q09_05925 [Deltaproteobacteria bacterium]|nr:hypothetical protein [Deltaproteobacteria bacterium]
MAEPPPDPPSEDQDDDDTDERGDEHLPTSQSVDTAQTSTPTADEDRDKRAGELVKASLDSNTDEPIYVTSISRTRLVANIVVGIALCTLVGWFVLKITMDSPRLGAALGFGVALLGARGRRERDELAPERILQSPDRRHAVELLFDNKPTLILEPKSVLAADAEATGNSREGLTHWVVVRQPEDKQFRVRARNRNEAIMVSYRLRVALGVSAFHPLGDDEIALLPETST